MIVIRSLPPLYDLRTPDGVSSHQPNHIATICQVIKSPLRSQRVASYPLSSIVSLCSTFFFLIPTDFLLKVLSLLPKTDPGGQQRAYRHFIHSLCLNKIKYLSKNQRPSTQKEYLIDSFHTVLMKSRASIERLNIADWCHLWRRRIFFGTCAGFPHVLVTLKQVISHASARALRYEFNIEWSVAVPKVRGV